MRDGVGLPLYQKILVGFMKISQVTLVVPGGALSPGPTGQLRPCVYVTF